MKQKSILLATFLVMLTGCTFRNRKWVDFTGERTFDENTFYVISQNNVDLEEHFPDDCYLPDGTPLKEYNEPLPEDINMTDGMTTMSSSTSITAVIQNLVGWTGNNKLVELSGIYYSYDDMSGGASTPRVLSGKVIMPADGKFKRYILVSHYTIGSNAEAPSNCFSLEGIFAKLGYCVIIPDYLGYGITADQVHPYMMMESTACHVISMFTSVRNLMESMNIKPQYDDIYLLGYSQGGATSMAVERMIEMYLQDDIKVRRVFAGGGPYDVKATYNRFVETNEASYPVAVPLVIQGMITGDTSLHINLKDILQPRIYDNIDEWVNSKKYSTAKVNKLINTRKTDEILTPLGMDRTSEAVCNLYKSLSRNSLVNYDWSPQVPVYMMHSIDDETVPFDANATPAMNKWSDANIQYNFGHYGGHVMTCVRFIFTVRGILKDEE